MPCVNVQFVIILHVETFYNQVYVELKMYIVNRILPHGRNLGTFFTQLKKNSKNHKLLHVQITINIPTCLVAHVT